MPMARSSRALARRWFRVLSCLAEVTGRLTSGKGWPCSYQLLRLTLERKSLALDQERPRKQVVLFPVRIDDAVMQTSEAWARLLRGQRNIGDFTRWKKHDSYQRSLERSCAICALERRRHRGLLAASAALDRLDVVHAAAIPLEPSLLQFGAA
jgi:hypothetical protein